MIRIHTALLAVAAGLLLWPGVVRGGDGVRDAVGDAVGDSALAPVTLTGEVVDLHCYLLHPQSGHGPDHAACANACIDRGLPTGFLAAGQLYVLLGPGHDPVGELVAGKAGWPMRLHGTLVEHAGLKAVQVRSLEPLTGSPTGSPPPSTRPAAGR